MPVPERSSVDGDGRVVPPILRALVGESEPLTQYFVGLKVDRLVTDDELLTLADAGLVSVWARWWKGHDAPVQTCAYALTERGAEYLRALYPLNAS